MKNKKFWTLSLALTGAAIIMPAIAISCSNETNNTPNNDTETNNTPNNDTNQEQVSKTKEEKLQDQFKIFIQEYENIRKDLTSSDTAFYNKFKTIGFVTNNSSKFINALLNTVKTVQPNDILMYGAEVLEPHKTNENLHRIERWFKENAALAQVLAYDKLADAKSVFMDAHAQVSSNLSKLNLPVNEINDSKSLQKFMQINKNKEINDIDMQAKIKMTYEFLKTRIYDKNESLVPSLEHDEHDHNHDEDAHQHSHSHALLNIITTAIDENLLILNDYVKLHKNVVEYSKFMDAANVKRIKSIFDIIIPKQDSSLDSDMKAIDVVKAWIAKLNEAKTTIKEQKEAFKKIYNPLSKMVEILGMNPSDTLL